MIAPFSDDDSDTVTTTTQLRQARRAVAAALFRVPKPDSVASTTIPTWLTWAAPIWMAVVLTAYVAHLMGWLS